MYHLFVILLLAPIAILMLIGVWVWAHYCPYDVAKLKLIHAKQMEIEMQKKVLDNIMHEELTKASWATRYQFNKSIKGG